MDFAELGALLLDLVCPQAKVDDRSTVMTGHVVGCHGGALRYMSEGRQSEQGEEKVVIRTFQVLVFFRLLRCDHVGHHDAS